MRLPQTTVRHLHTVSYSTLPTPRTRNSRVFTISFPEDLAQPPKRRAERSANSWLARRRGGRGTLALSRGRCLDRRSRQPPRRLPGSERRHGHRARRSRFSRPDRHRRPRPSRFGLLPEYADNHCPPISRRSRLKPAQPFKNSTPGANRRGSHHRVADVVHLGAKAHRNRRNVYLGCAMKSVFDGLWQ